MEEILNRRSIRRYEKKDVPPDLVRELLRAGMAAPSAANEQPWHFVVITDRSILDEIPTFHPYARMLKEAPCVIAVCGDLSLEICKGFWVQDCSAATQNILTEAVHLGLGAVWLGIYPETDRTEAVQKLLGLPEQVLPLSLIAIGWPAEAPKPADRFQESRIHENRWIPPSA